MARQRRIRKKIERSKLDSPLVGERDYKIDDYRKPFYDDDDYKHKGGHQHKKKKIIF